MVILSRQNFQVLEILLTIQKTVFTFSFGFCFTGKVGRGAIFFCLLCSVPRKGGKNYEYFKKLTATCREEKGKKSAG